MADQNKLFVGNLPWKVTEDDIRTLLDEYGTVGEVKFIHDRETERFRGFGFVVMGTPDEAQAVIHALDGKEYEGRELTINVAKPREPHRSSPIR